MRLQKPEITYVGILNDSVIHTSTGSGEDCVLGGAPQNTCQSRQEMMVGHCMDDDKCLGVEFS